MKDIKTKEEYIKAIKEIKEHDRKYYEECKPLISDYEYDLLLKKIEKFEKQHHFIAENSPTKRITDVLTKGFSRGKHLEKMLSLSNTYSKEEIRDFVHRVYKLIGKKVAFCMELKIDGAAVSLTYEKGILKRALTRGNGIIGDDVTNNIKTVRSLPLKLKTSPAFLEIKAEVFMHKNTFFYLNKKREEEGLDVFANPRNACAGSLKLLDSKEVSKRRLDILCYGISKGEAIVETQFELHKYLKELSLPVLEKKYFAKAESIEEIFSFADKIEKLRKDLFFEIDGIVIKVDPLKYHKTLGSTGKSPRFAVAYKFAPEQAETVIEDITVQVGRTGVLTPVANLKPVSLAGSTISRATLHNQDEIKRKDIRIGDFVVIEKGGDVIPKVVSVDLKKRKKSVLWKMPNRCPVCRKKVFQKKGEVAFRCLNKKCFGRKLRHLIFFASKQAMDIENLGEKIIEKLVEKNLISAPCDIFRLQKEDIENLEGFKEKSSQNLLQSIEKAKKPEFWRFILSLEIPYVGKETASLLASHAKNMRELEKISKEELLSIEGVGEKVAESILQYFSDEENIKEIEKLFKYGVHPIFSSKKIKGHNFSGKTFVLTGTLESFTRDEASSLIKERGGKTSSSVSKKTDYLLLGENPGSKYKKAISFGVKILKEGEFKKML